MDLQLEIILKLQILNYELLNTTNLLSFLITNHVYKENKDRKYRLTFVIGHSYLISRREQQINYQYIQWNYQQYHKLYSGWRRTTQTMSELPHCFPAPSDWEIFLKTTYSSHLIQIVVRMWVFILWVPDHVQQVWKAMAMWTYWPNSLRSEDVDTQVSFSKCKLQCFIKIRNHKFSET